MDIPIKTKKPLNMDPRNIPLKKNIGFSTSGIPIPFPIHPSTLPRYQIASVLRATEEVLMVDSRPAVW